MAADPALLTLLVGLGLREFSMTPGRIPLAKQVLRSLNAEDARHAARRALAGRAAADVEHALAELLVPTRPLGWLNRASDATERRAGGRRRPQKEHTCQRA